MMFTAEEKRLLDLYLSDSLAETVAAVRSALPDIFDTYTQAITAGLLRKLENTSKAEFESFAAGSGCFL